MTVIFGTDLALSSDNPTQSIQPADVMINTQLGRVPIEPIPDTPSLDPEKVNLGERLFHDKRLDRDKRMACADCHSIENGGTDKLAFSVNSNGEATQFNTPTIFNVALNSKYYWSGKFVTLEEQMTDALNEINTTWPDLIRTLKAIPRYRDAFDALYPDGVTVENIQDVFVHFEHSLLTPNSAFDRYLKGDAGALNRNEFRGYELFKSYGCITCHQGKNIGGNILLNANKANTSFGKLTSINARLKGKIKYIRVPSLRNVAITAPYFHDGSATSLYQAVQRMIDEYIGIEADDEEIHYIVSFLKSLTGEYKGKKL
ncbi:MAG: cytochrome c peroxidase [Gammaproteobacteria bacterium]